MKRTLFIVSLPRDSGVNAQKLGKKRARNRTAGKNAFPTEQLGYTSTKVIKKASTFGEYTKKRPPEKRGENSKKKKRKGSTETTKMLVEIGLICCGCTDTDNGLCTVYQLSV